MNDEPSVYDAVIADLRAKRDEIDQLIARLELFRKLNREIFSGSLSGTNCRRSCMIP